MLWNPNGYSATTSGDPHIVQHARSGATVKILFAPAALMVSYPVEKRDIVAYITPGFLTLNPFVAKNFLSFAQAKPKIS